MTTPIRVSRQQTIIEEFRNVQFIYLISVSKIEGDNRFIVLACADFKHNDILYDNYTSSLVTL